MGIRPPGSRPGRLAADVLGPIPSGKGAKAELARWGALRSVSLHRERAEEAERLFYRSLVTAHDTHQITFQQIADHLGISKHWAWKLYQKAKDL